MDKETKKAFEEALKFKKCQEVNTEEFCSQYIKEDENCGECPHFVEEAQGFEAEEKVLNYALNLFEQGKLETV